MNTVTMVHICFFTCLLFFGVFFACCACIFLLHSMLHKPLFFGKEGYRIGWGGMGCYQYMCISFLGFNNISNGFKGQLYVFAMSPATNKLNLNLAFIYQQYTRNRQPKESHKPRRNNVCTRQPCFVLTDVMIGKE